MTIEEVEEICQERHKEIKSYRKRFLLKGKTKMGRKLEVIVSPEDKEGNLYDEGIYYVITAYEKEQI